MFGIGPMEFLVIAVVAVLFVGPDKLPDVLKKFGRFYVQAKRHANDVKAGFDDAIHAAERELELERIRELQREITKLTLSTGTDTTVVDAAHTDLSAAIPKESHDEGHTPDGRLIAAGETHESALPPGEHEDHEHARKNESTYHEGHLPAHIRSEDKDPFAADVLTNPSLTSHDEKTASGEPIKEKP